MIELREREKDYAYDYLQEKVFEICGECQIEEPVFPLKFNVRHFGEPKTEISPIKIRLTEEAEIQFPNTPGDNTINFVNGKYCLETQAPISIKKIIASLNPDLDEFIKIHPYPNYLLISKNKKALFYKLWVDCSLRISLYDKLERAFSKGEKLRKCFDYLKYTDVRVFKTTGITPVFELNLESPHRNLKLFNL